MLYGSLQAFTLSWVNFLKITTYIFMKLVSPPSHCQFRAKKSKRTDTSGSQPGAGRLCKWCIESNLLTCESHKHLSKFKAWSHCKRRLSWRVPGIPQFYRITESTCKKVTYCAPCPWSVRNIEAHTNWNNKCCVCTKHPQFRYLAYHLRFKILKHGFLNNACKRFR